MHLSPDSQREPGRCNQLLRPSRLQRLRPTILYSDARIPLVEKMGTYYYNFRKDKQHEQQTHMQALAYSFLKRMLMQK